MLSRLFLQSITPRAYYARCMTKMHASTSPSSADRTLKRRREPQDISTSSEPSPTRLKIRNLPRRPLIQKEMTSSRNPRTNMEGHMQRLDLHDLTEVSKLDFGESPSQSDVGRAPYFEPDVRLPNKQPSEPHTPPSSSHGLVYPTANESIRSLSSCPPPRSPETPRSRPTASPTPPPSAKESNAKIAPSALSALWWSDTEITGHDPDPNDPMDDGEGINGVGFLPTPAIAFARAARRRRQVKEWKERETREARAQRGERRLKRDIEEMIVTGVRPEDEENGRKVRFFEI